MEKNKTLREPSDPMRILARMQFITNIGAAIQLGNNWPRLGRPEYRTLTIWLPIAGIAVTVAELVGGIFWAAESSSDYAFGLVMTFGLTLFAGSMMVLFAAAYLQHGAFKVWQETGDMEAVAQHEYNITKWQIIAGAVMGVMLVGGLALTFING